MYPRFCLPALFLAPALFPLHAHAASQPFTQATFTQVVNDVAIVKTASNQRLRAAPQVTVQAPDLVATGGDSRAELQWPDATLTRVGANTVFSFSSDDRRIDLKQGSLLFHSPAGKGGGTIQTAAVTAAITGTTIIISCTPDGGFKFLVLEGKGTARLPNGHKISLLAGQLVFVLPGSKKFSPVLNYRILEQTGGAKLVDNFSQELPSLPKIKREITRQEHRIQQGHLRISGYLAGDQATPDGAAVVDPNSIQYRNSGGAAHDFALSLLNDAFINQPLVNTNRIFPAMLAPQAFLLTGLDPKRFDVQFSNIIPADRAFAARNINITTPILTLAGTTPFPGNLVFFAAQNISLPPSLNIANGPIGVDFFAGNVLSIHNVSFSQGGLDFQAEQIFVSPGSTLSAYGDDLWLASVQPLTLQNVNLANPVGNVEVESRGDLTLTGGSLHARTTALPALLNEIHLNSERDISVTGTAFTAHDVKLAAKGQILVDGANFSGVTNMFIADSDAIAGFKNINFPSFNFISISARTPVLDNVHFAAGTNVNINSASGTWVGAASLGGLPGGVITPLKANFINSFYSTTPLTGSGGPGTIPSTQVTIGTHSGSPSP